MFRKLMIATAAAAALGAAALSPTAASAGWHGGGHWRGHGPFFGIGFYNNGYYGDCVLEKHKVMTPRGWRSRWYRVCY
jgi:hypothetical protein